MLRSLAREGTEFEVLDQPEHIEKIWAEISKNLPDYWEKWVDAEMPDEEEVPKLFGQAMKPTEKPSEAMLLTKIFDKAIGDYEKEAEKYREFFHEEALEEYEDDPNAFKQGLSKEMPVIAKTLRQRNEELKEWQKQYHLADANELLSVFVNVLDFYSSWSEDNPVGEYVEFDTPEEYDLNEINNDEDMNLSGVIGMGIKTITLYHTDPERMPPLGRFALFGLYFLSGRIADDMPSESSEFLMINDQSKAANGSYVMDQNYWYPYSVFSMYLQRIFRWIQSRAEEANFLVDHKFRYVYVERFLEGVSRLHADDMKTMRAHDSYGIPV